MFAPQLAVEVQSTPPSGMCFCAGFHMPIVCWCRSLCCCLQVSGEPIPVPKVDPSNKELFNKTVNDIHAKVGRGG
jgi:hypothetical protein